MAKRILCLILAAILVLGLVLMGVTTVSAADMTASPEAVAFLKNEEGFSKKPYWDYAQWTVGYGTRCPDDKLDEYKANGIPEAEAEALLREQLAGFENAVRKFATKTGVSLAQHQFDALVMLTYNCGAGWSYSAGGQLYKAVANGATGSALIDAFSRWCNAGGDVKTFLLRRRLCEANMYLNGVYSNKAPENFGYVIYDGNGGTCSPSVQGYETSEAPAILATATHASYSFAGWYTQKNGGKKLTNLDASVRNERLYARWDTPVEDTTGTKTIVTATGVNVRQGPGTTYSVVGMVDLDDVIYITETAEGNGYTWGKFSGGWVCLQFTDYKAPTPPATEPAPTEPAPTEPPKTEDTVIATGTVKVSDSLRIRSGAGTGYGVVGTLKNGEKVEILEKKTVGSAVWGRIAKGWISLEYVTVDQPKEPEKTEEAILTGTVKVSGTLRVRKEPGTAGAVVGYLENGAKVTVTQEKTVGTTRWGKIATGWISLDYVIADGTETPVQKITGTVKVSDTLRVRSGPGTTYAIAGYLKNGAKVTVTEEKTVGATTWGRVEKGWISMSYVVRDGAAAQPQKQYKTVTADCLRVRSGPGSSNKIVGFLYAGDRVEILETSGTWGRIATGWISLSYTK